MNWIETVPMARQRNVRLKKIPLQRKSAAAVTPQHTKNPLKDVCANI